MATTKAKFEGWSYFEENKVAESGASERRSRRSGAADSRLVLKREIDGLEIKSGDTIVMTDPDDGATIVVLIVNVEIGISDYMVLTGLNFLGKSEVESPPDESYDQELFLTSVGVTVYVEDIIGGATVLNEQDFNKIVIDDSNKDSTFISRKGYDTYYKTFTDTFNIDEIREDMKKDPSGEVERLRDFIVPSMYTRKKSTTPLPKKEKIPAPGRKSTSSSRSNTKSSKLEKAKPKRRINEVVISDDEEVHGSESENSSDVELLESSSDDEDEDDDADIIRDDDDEFKPRQQARKTNIKRRINGKNKRQKISGLQSLAVSKGKGGLESGEASILPCREDQFEELYSILESSIEMEVGTCVYISGTPGTGKTVTVREVVRSLYQKTRSESKELNDFQYLEINGMKLLTPQSAYEALWDKVSKGEKVPATGLVSKLEEYFDREPKYETVKGEEVEKNPKFPLIVLLDELDEIAKKSQAVMYNFFNWPTYSNSKLIIIAVANTMDLPERYLTNKTSSRLGLQRIQFPGYSHEDLTQIIYSKFELLKQDNVEMKDDAIQFAARKVASVSGDARRALRICRRAFQIAKQQAEAEDSDNEKQENSGKPIQVQAVHINRAIMESTNSPIAQFISDLSFVSKLVLVAILSKKRKTGLAENKLGEIIDECKEIVSYNSSKDSSTFVIEDKSILDIVYEDFIIRPKGFDYVLSELIESGLLLQQNRKSDRNSLVKLNVADEELTSVFKKEKSLQYFLDLITSQD